MDKTPFPNQCPFLLIIHTTLNFNVPKTFSVAVLFISIIFREASMEIVNIPRVISNK